MVHREPLLVTLVKLVDEIPMPEAAPIKRRGRPKGYADRLMLKALLIMIIRRLYSAYSRLTFLEPETELTVQLRQRLTEQGRFPARRTWERRLAQLPDPLPGLIGCLGRHLVALIRPYPTAGRAAALDSTPLRAKGGVWHQKDREQGKVPHSTLDTEAGGSKSGYPGWWYGWKLHVASTVASIWIPLAAYLTVANTHDSSIAVAWAHELPEAGRFWLGDQHYRDPALQQHCRLTGRTLVTSQPGPYPHEDAGVEVRRSFHKLRSKAIEPFNGLFKNIFEGGGPVPVRGLRPTQRVVFGAVLLYQVVLLYQFQHHLPLGQGIKPFLRAA